MVREGKRAGLNEQKILGMGGGEWSGKVGEYRKQNDMLCDFGGIYEAI